MDDFHRRQEQETAISAARTADSNMQQTLSAAWVPLASAIRKIVHI
jgi:predicted RNA-binding protein Jag